MEEIKLLDVIALVEDLDSEGLKRGEVGTVVEEWKVFLKLSSAMITGTLTPLPLYAPNKL